MGICIEHIIFVFYDLHINFWNIVIIPKISWVYSDDALANGDGVGILLLWLFQQCIECIFPSLLSRLFRAKAPHRSWRNWGKQKHKNNHQINLLMNILHRLFTIIGFCAVILSFCCLEKLFYRRREKAEVNKIIVYVIIYTKKQENKYWSNTFIK